jgi:hypothetical protein
MDGSSFCESSSIEKLTDLPIREFLSGNLDPQCAGACGLDNFLTGLADFRIIHFRCCILSHPYASLALVSGVVCLICVFLFYLFFGRSTRSGGVYTLQVLTFTSHPSSSYLSSHLILKDIKNGGEYKLKIDFTNEKIILVSKPQYEVCDICFSFLKQ